MIKKTSALLFGLLLSIGVQTSLAQITITPIFLYLDQQERFGSILVMNGSEQEQEVSISFTFGYPITDENGNINMVYDDSSKAETWGISDAVRSFPQNFTLQPGQRQVVRLTIQPRDLEDRMYYTRVKTTSTPVSPSVGETSEDNVTTQITYKFEQITTLFYKHGEVNTGVEINNLNTEQTEEEVKFIADLSRNGNAPFLGSIVLNIKNEEGESVIERRTSTSIYFNYRQVFNINKENLPSGNYTAELTIVSERGDVSRSDIISIEPITQTVNLEVK